MSEQTSEITFKIKMDENQGNNIDNTLLQKFEEEIWNNAFSTPGIYDSHLGGGEKWIW